MRLANLPPARRGSLLARAANQLHDSVHVLVGLATKRRSHSAPRQSPTSVPPAIMADDAEVDALKAAGNDAFKKGDFSGAVSNYDKAILLAPKNHLLYSNRSLAKHSAGDFVAAEADARKCLELAPDFMKGVYRLANAQLGQNDVDAAEDTVRKGLALGRGEPGTQEARKGHQGPGGQGQAQSGGPGGHRCCR